MKEVKDNFSVQSDGYSKFRPVYPTELYDEILSHVNTFDKCWDCATGNGQMASVLAGKFREVKATDISAGQLAKAIKRENVVYSEKRAEQTDFASDSFDLITVGQAVHWFDHEHFNEEVKRVGKVGGIIALIGYGLMYVNEPFDLQLATFYNDTIGSYWDSERRHIDSNYSSIPFPFKPISLNSDYSIDVEWNLQQLEGYLGTWSSVNRYIQQHGKDPVAPFIEQLTSSGVWEESQVHEVHFPLFVKLGVIDK